MIEVKIEDYCKDHWSLLGFIESRVEAYNVGPNTGRLDLRHMRVNPTLHPQFNNGNGWKPEYGSRLQGYWVEGQPNNPDKLILDHDDIHCLEDMERAGLIEWQSSANMFVKLTPYGVEVASRLRRHKLEGKNYSEFKI
jgi:hypothetical protein